MYILFVSPQNSCFDTKTTKNKNKRTTKIIITCIYIYIVFLFDGHHNAGTTGSLHIIISYFRMILIIIFLRFEKIK